MPENNPTVRSVAKDSSLFVGNIHVIATEHRFTPELSEIIVDLRCVGKATERLQGSGVDLSSAIAATLRPICNSAFNCETTCDALGDELVQYSVHVSSVESASRRSGFGRFTYHDAVVGTLIATLRALHHAGILRSEYRANNQKPLRDQAALTWDELIKVVSPINISEHQRNQALAIITEEMNRVASAAVLTATNTKAAATVLNLFDTSAWLYDSNGNRRDSYTETNFWLAWYPGLNNGMATIDEVLGTLPAAAPNDIPWIVRLFENPESWIRFRGAVSLAGHDVMHILLGRGLQDQDEAFVIGFAMGTAKRPNILQRSIFRWAISRLYPEPYRIPKHLLPAFDLGVACGRETGAAHLYKRDLTALRHVCLEEARARCEIDLNILRKYYRLEQDAIPLTIASIRLPV